MKKTKKKTGKKIKQNDNDIFDFNNEIVIGLTRIDDDKKKEKKRINKKQNRKENKKRTKKSNKKTDIKGKKILKKKNTQTIANNNINEQDIIIPSKVNNNKKKTNRRNMKLVKIISITLLVIAAIIAAMMSPLFNIKEITVEGNNKLTSDEIISLSNINLNENTYRTSMNKAKKNILQNPYVKDVKIERDLPSKVVIKINERRTDFMIEFGGGYVYVNNQGYILEVSNESLNVPILQGTETQTEDFIPGKRLCLGDLEKMSTVIKIMEIAEVNEISDLITRIDMENKQNYKIVFESEQKVANLGDSTDLNTKILSIKSILEREKQVAGEIFVNVDLNTTYPVFRQNV